MRADIVADWLAGTPWGNWHRAAMTGDASARRYERLSHGDAASVILMDAPPDTCGSQFHFVEIAAHLRGLGLAAPEVFEWNESLGLMILEDLGDTDFATHLRDAPQDELALYEAAIDTLLVLQSSPPPSGLIAMTPDVGAQMIDLAFEWAAPHIGGDQRDEINGHIHDLLNAVDPNPSTLSLRDFHAENLIWRPRQNGTSQVGLLDFQDAFVTHPAYDLASLLRDARRDVDPALLDPLLRRMSPAASDLAPMKDAFSVMAVQRNLRILGIFHRLAKQDGKTQYLHLIPRVWSHLETDLAAPICAALAPLIHRAFDPKGARS